MSENENSPDDLESEESSQEVAFQPNEAADPIKIVEAKIPQDIRSKFEILSYRNAAVILSETRQSEFEEILNTLRGFFITADMIKKAGGNESDIPKIFSAALHPAGWRETVIQADLVVRLSWREQTGLNKKGKPVFERRVHETKRERYLDGHKIDYVKNRVAFDLEWNSKDQTFDRDLYAFNTFFQSGAIDAGILVTRGASLTPVLRELGQGAKYGASTTWWGKLVYRLNAGRNGGCPVLAVGITPACINDWQNNPKK